MSDDPSPPIRQEPTSKQVLTDIWALRVSNKTARAKTWTPMAHFRPRDEEAVSICFHGYSNVAHFPNVHPIKTDRHLEADICRQMEAFTGYPGTSVEGVTVFRQALDRPERNKGTVGVEPLCRCLRSSSERLRTSDVVSVSVGRDGASALVPRGGGRPAGRGAEGLSPRLPREHRLVEHGGRSRLDQVGALDQGLVHGRVHRPERTRD